MKTVICFDWDGTVVDSMALCVAEVKLAMQRLGLPEPSDEDCRWCNGPSYEETVRHLHIPADMAQTYIDERQKANVELCREYNRLYPGMKELLEHLHGKAILCVASNGHKAYIEHCIHLFGLEGIFTRIEAAQPGRSKAQALQVMLDDFGCDRAVMVGDRAGDFRAGRACGTHTMAACFGFGCEEEWADADERAYTVAELEEKLLHFLQ